MKDPCVTQAQKESETPTSKLEIPETLKSLENIERTEIAIKKELKKNLFVRKALCSKNCMKLSK